MSNSRYFNNTTKTNKDGRVVYRGKKLKRIPLSNDDKYVVIQDGDRLDTIANQYYEDSSLWWIIASANNIHDPSFTLKEGTILRIPIEPYDIINENQG
jgi:nucleoid-associated protein YgaU